MCFCTFKKIGVLIFFYKTKYLSIPPPGWGGGIDLADALVPSETK